MWVNRFDWCCPLSILLHTHIQTRSLKHKFINILLRSYTYIYIYSYISVFCFWFPLLFEQNPPTPLGQNRQLNTIKCHSFYQFTQPPYHRLIDFIGRTYPCTKLVNLVEVRSWNTTFLRKIRLSFLKMIRYRPSPQNKTKVLPIILMLNPFACPPSNMLRVWQWSQHFTNLFRWKYSQTLPTTW